MNSIEFDGDELEAATSWHSGQSSMLYAISSTGSLKRGTIRPYRDCDCEHGCVACNGQERVPMSNVEWLASLAERLAGEAEEAADQAIEQAKEADSDEEKELLESNAHALMSIAAKCAAAVDILIPEGK